MNNYVYSIDGTAYVNLTNRCQNACSFCIRNNGDGVAGTPLWLDNEGSVDDVMACYNKIQPRLKTNEIVFCGYGEPTEALELLKECAKRFKALGLKTRLNTNGLGSLSAGRSIACELKGVIDTVSVSLNSFDSQSYLDITNSKFGLKAFDGVLDFIKDCKEEGINTVVTVVDVIGEDAEKKCKDLSDSLGVPLRVREYISDNYVQYAPQGEGNA